MTETVCAYCGGPMNLPRRGAKFCSQKCGTYFRRKSRRLSIPAELTRHARWVRWDLRLSDGRPTKVPLTITGRFASSTDPATWMDYETAVSTPIGAGLGFVVNGDGIACVDLDGVLSGSHLDPRAAEFIASLSPFYVEVSPSGSGIHAWVHGGSPDGRKVFTLSNGLKVEWYSDSRYLTVTGKEFK